MNLKNENENEKGLRDSLNCSWHRCHAFIARPPLLPPHIHRFPSQKYLTPRNCVPPPLATLWGSASMRAVMSQLQLIAADYSFIPPPLSLLLLLSPPPSPPPLFSLSLPPSLAFDRPPPGTARLFVSAADCWVPAAVVQCRQGRPV